MTLLDVQELSVAIRGTPILDAASFAVAPGETVALVGESGSGKSMTALAIMGLLPDGAEKRGRVDLHVDGRRVDLLAAPEATLCRLRGRALGMVFQEPMTALNPLMTIGDQVAETIHIHEPIGRAAARRRARDVLARAGLPPDRFPPTRYPHELSGGQRQRVVIACAIALRPPLLIADEPTTALDVTTQAQILDLLKMLVAEIGMGLLLITHDLAVVNGVADRVAVMRRGQVVETGPVAQVFAERRHPYTQALFAASAHQADLPAVDADAPLLEVADVVRDYPGRWSPFGRRPATRAVDGVSFSLKRGERLGLVGESGCGKSTLARAILGLEPVDAGRITLDGASVHDGRRPNRAVRRRMQVVFQDPYGSFNPRHRVERLVAEPFHAFDDPPRGGALRAAIDQSLEAVGLRAADAEKYVHEFSGGQRQRIAIARALITRPELIVFDEPVSALDVSVRAQVLDLLAALSAEMSLSYLFISHDLSVVRSITDRVLVMRAGAIVEAGETAAVFETPRHAYTRALIAAAPKPPVIDAV